MLVVGWYQSGLMWRPMWAATVAVLFALGNAWKWWLNVRRDHAKDDLAWVQNSRGNAHPFGDTRQL
jgi:hypothetical protein